MKPQTLPPCSAALASVQSATRWLLAAIALISLPALADEFDAIFQQHGATYDVDWRLLKATCEVESHLNPRAEHPGGLSAGLCQIHCAPAHAVTCHNSLDTIGWPPASREQLYDPDYNVSQAAQILGWNLRTFGLQRGVAVYNQWSARRTPKGKPFPNQFYVDRVLRRYRELQGLSNEGAPTWKTEPQRAPSALPNGSRRWETTRMSSVNVV